MQHAAFRVPGIIAGGDTADTDTCILQFLEVTDYKDPSVHILFLQKHKKYIILTTTNKNNHILTTWN